MRSIDRGRPALRVFRSQIFFYYFIAIHVSSTVQMSTQCGSLWILGNCVSCAYVFRFSSSRDRSATASTTSNHVIIIIIIIELIGHAKDDRREVEWERERERQKKCTKELSRMIDAAQSRKLVVDGYRPLLLHTACTREKLRNGQTNSTFRIFSGANAQRPATLFRITARGK